MPATTQKDFRLYLPALTEYRAAQSRRLAAAFCEVPEFVMGCPVEPVTPRTFTMLLASGNRFAVGGRPTEDDVLNFIWFHSASYVHAGHPEWATRKRAALRPFTRQMRQAWLRWVGLKPSVDRQLVVLVLAMGEIRDLLTEAFACASKGGNGPVLATLEAQMIHGFAAAYRWPAEKTRNTPLRQLFQLDRMLARSRGGEVPDEGEQAILADHLRRRNEEARPAREAAEAKREADLAAKESAKTNGVQRG